MRTHMNASEARKLKNDLWDAHGHLDPAAWPEKAQAQLEEACEVLEQDWLKRYQRMLKRKEKRLAAGGEWHEKTIDDYLRELRREIEERARKYSHVDFGGL